MSNTPFLFVPTFSWPAVPFGLLYAYQAGSTTPKTTYSDAAGLIPNTNPIELDATGAATVRLGTGSYKFVLLDQTNTVTIWEQDDYDSQFFTQEAVGEALYPISQAEITASVTPVSFFYPYGCPRRFGAVGDGATDDTLAVQSAINSNPIYYGWPGDIYGVSSVIWPASYAGGDFNGSKLIGIATSAQNCISQIKCNFATFTGYAVDGGSFNGIVPNSNYICGTWWFNGTVSGSPVGASQFNTFYGMQHISCTRGLVYGGLPTASASTIVHSENKIYSFQTDGVANPIYVNSSTGFLHCYGSTFFRDASTWTTPTLPTTARALETPVGNLYVHGGEIIASNSLVGFAADLTGTIIDGTYIELSAPLQIMGDNVRLTNCRAQVLNQGVSMFTINSAATGVLAVANSTLFRPAGTGATDRTSLVDGTSAATFEVDFENNDSFEWGFAMAGANCKLIKGCIARYCNHRLSITAADSNVYILNDPKVSLIPELTLDHMGYTLTGWTNETISGGGTTFTVTTNAGPTGYLASQITLHATGQSRQWSGDPTSLTTLKATALRVKPGNVFWLSGWVQSSGGTAQLLASFYTLAGAAVSTILAADSTSIGTAAWVFAEGPIAAPSTAAYMIFGVQGLVSDVQFTDVKLQRA